MQSSCKVAPSMNLFLLFLSFKVDNESVKWEQITVRLLKIKGQYKMLFSESGVLPCCIQYVKRKQKKNPAATI
jgi:hypothetical protein